MIEDKSISSTMGVRSLAEAQSEETTQSDTNDRTIRGFGSNRKQSQTDEGGKQNSPLSTESQLAPNTQTEGQAAQANDTQVTNGEVQVTNSSVPAVVDGDDQNLNDIELARTNVQNIIELGDDAVKEMVSIAKQSESPRAFEVVSTLMKTLLDANKEFVDISSKKKFAQDEKIHGRPETNITNNNLIVSTADLLSMIKGEDNGNT